MAAAALALGDSADLWAGFDPVFPGRALPWRVPPGRPARSEPLVVPETPPHWGEPVLSLHADAADLLGRLLDLRVEPMIALEGPLAITVRELPAAPPTRITLASGESVPLRADAAYLLVRLTGVRGTSFYSPEWLGLNRKIRLTDWTTPAGRGAGARLRLSAAHRADGRFHGELTAREARRYLDYFDAMGTHLVRSVTHGERLFQIFTVDRVRLPALRRAFGETGGTDELAGAAAFGMAHLARPPWVTTAGPILAASGDPATRDLAAHELWRGERPDDPPSLLSRRALLPARRAAVLARVAARTVVGVTFASQAAMLEDFRADAWSRLMRAGLCQRFPALVFAGWEPGGRFRPDVLMASAGLTGDEALCKPPAPDVPAFAFVLDLRHPCTIADAGSGCTAFFAVTDAASGRAAACHVAADGFDPATWTIASVDGAATVTQADGTRFCLTDGVWLGGGIGARAAIAGSPSRPDGAALARLASHLAPRLAAHLDLMDQLRAPLVAPAVDAAMRRSAGWLVEVCGDRPDFATLARHARRVAAETDDAEAVPITGEVLRAGMDLLALPADAAGLGTAAQTLDRRSCRPAADGPQLHRLVVLLTLLRGCAAAGLPVASLADLSPATLADRLDRARAAINPARPAP